MGSRWFTPTLTAGNYMSIVLGLLLAFGVAFELPVVITVLASLGIVSPRFLRTKRRHALVAIAVVASFLTPGDVITVTLLLMIPLVVLYEVSIVLAAFVHRRRYGGGDGERFDEALLLVLGLATAGWRNRRRRVVELEGVQRA